MPKRQPRKPVAPPPAGSFEHWHDGLSESERRIDLVVQRMQSGSWLSGVSERALAKEWNVSPDRVQKLAAEASRVVRRRLREDPASREEAKAQVVQTFEVIRAKAMAKGDPASLRVALDATRALGFYLGVEPAKQLDVGRREDPFEGWSTEEKLAYSRDGSRPRRALRQVLGEGNGADGTDGGGEPGVH